MNFTPDDVTWVLGPKDLGFLGAALADTPEVTLDLETTGLDEHAVTGGSSNGGVAARIVLASFTMERSGSDRLLTWVLPLSHPESPFSGRWRQVITDVCDLLREECVALIGQHLKFDLRWLHAHTGIDLSPLHYWDTQISSHLLDENASTKLKERAPATFGIERWDDFDLKTPGAAEQVPMFQLGIYGAQDTFWTHRLMQEQRRRMFAEPDHDEEPETFEEAQEARLGQLAVNAAMPSGATLAAIEQRGMRLDAEWCRDTLRTLESDVQRLSDDVRTMYADVGEEHQFSLAPTSRWFQAFTETAEQRGDLRVLSMTKTGKPQWSGDVLKQLERDGYLLAGTLLEHREAAKRAEFLRSWLGKVSVDGRIHATYNIGSVVTGRLSSSGPNLQQVTKSLKPAFVPSEGNVFIELDYSQVELRVAAFISRSEPMIQAYRDGDDLHRMLAARISGKPLDEVTKAERQAGKSANFGLLYGMSPGGFQHYALAAYDVQFTPEEAEAVHAAFFDQWDGISAWHARAIAQVGRQGSVTSPIGRVRRLPEVWDGNDYFASRAERAAINSPVQGFASDLMQMAAAGIEGNLPGVDRVDGAAIVGTVHDSILVEAPEDVWQDVVQECTDRMEHAVLDHLRRRFRVDFDLPLVADSTVGTRWGLADLKTDDEPVRF